MERLLVGLHVQLAEIYASRDWRFVRRLRQICIQFFPPNSRQEAVVRFLFRILRG